MKPEVATRRIKTFGERFGEAHLYLAYHAAFPLALTPDLLYRMWANFQRDINGEALNIPWMGVADLLLSSLCDEVGHELYEMDTVVRNVLLKELKENSRFDEKRINELSDFLLVYVQQQLDSHDPDMRDFAQTQRWTALAYTQPSEAAREIASVLAGLKLEDKAEWIRMASLVETFAEPLAEFQPLLIYSQQMANFIRGNQEGATTKITGLLANQEPLYTGVKRILAVDDNPDNLILLETIFESQGYEIELVTDGVTALKQVAQSPPDLILLDVKMPEIDGYEVTRRIRENPEIPYIPILLITAYHDASVVEGLDAGADDFIRKPFDHEELLALVRSLLRRLKYVIAKITGLLANQEPQLHIAGVNLPIPEQIASSVKEVSSITQLSTNLSSSESYTGVKRILAVDDNPDNLILLETILESEGYKVELISNGMHALEQIAQDPPDLILLDVMMPEIDGYEVTRRIRQNREISYIPILLITAYHDASVVEGLDAGADDFIRKPFDHEELLARVRSLLRLKDTMSKMKAI